MSPRWKVEIWWIIFTHTGQMYRSTTITTKYRRTYRSIWWYSFDCNFWTCTDWPRVVGLQSLLQKKLEMIFYRKKDETRRTGICKIIKIHAHDDLLNKSHPMLAFFLLNYSLSQFSNRTTQHIFKPFWLFFKGGSGNDGNGRKWPRWTSH